MIVRPLQAATLVFILLAAAAWAADPPEGAKAFDALVPPAEVRAALVNLDPAALASTAAKIAAAEKVLGKSRPGVSAVQMYEVAIRIGGGRRTTAVLDRLAADDAVKADPRLAALVAATRLAAASSRNTDPELVVALDQISPDEFALFRGYLTQIQDAKSLADAEALAALSDHVSSTQDLNGAQRKYLAKLIGSTRASLPKKPPATAVVAVQQARSEAIKLRQVETPMVKPAPSGGDSEESPSGQSGSLASRLRGDTSALVDDGFDGKIDLAKIGKAWSRGDAASLADNAFRMADEERLLGRPHRHVPAKVLFQASFGLAIANADQATVARLEKGLKGDRAPDFDGKEEFLAKLTNSKGLVAMSRKGKQPLLASIEDTSPESYRAFRTYLDRIRAAGAQRDLGMLAGLTEGLDAVVELDDGQRAYLVREAADAKKAGPGQPIAAAGVLRTLESDLRVGNLPALNREVVKFCREQVGKKVGSGASGALAAQAFERAGAKPPSTVAGNPRTTWGMDVKPAEALPGDVIGFDDVVLAITFPDGHSQSWAYPQHTAIISAVDDRGRITTFQQDVGPAGKSEAKKQLVQVGYLDLGSRKQGTISIYRPVAR